jgi:plastocyanin
MKRLSRYAPALLSAALLVGASPALAQTKQVRIVAKEYGFKPKSLTVKPGQKVAVTLVNQGTTPHSIEFQLPEGMTALQKTVPPGQTGTVEFTAPSQPGTYSFDCPVANHIQLGMKGTLTVAR